MLIWVCLEIVLILKQDRCTVCAECTIGSEIVLVDPMDLLNDIGHLESCFNPFGDCVIVSAKLRVRFAPNIAHKSFWTHPIVLLGDKAQVDARFGLFRDSANLDTR
jgi:hypothetical protein